MIDGVKILRELNEKAVLFTYNGVTFGWTKERLEKATKAELEKAVADSHKNSERLKVSMKKYKEEYRAMSNEQKEEIDCFFERWNEFNDED